MGMQVLILPDLVCFSSVFSAWTCYGMPLQSMELVLLSHF